MNVVKSFIDRQIGLCNFTTHDSVLNRLVVTPGDSYRGIRPSVLGADYNPQPPIFACRFAEHDNYRHILAIANEDGAVSIQDTQVSSPAESEHPPLEGFQCHNNAVFDLAWMPNSLNFVTASCDHTAKLWDSNGSITLIRTFPGHTKSIKTVAFKYDDSSVFATAARDGNIMLWDTRAHYNVDVIAKPENCIYNCHAMTRPKTPGSESKKTARLLKNQRPNSVTGLIFQDSHTLISCGASDGSIKVWDLRKNYSGYKRDPLPRHSIPYCGSSSTNGYTNLILDQSRLKLFANCMDNAIYCFNLSTYSGIPEQRYVGHENASFFIKSSLSPDCNYLISGSTNEKAFVWNVKYSDPIIQLEGHAAEVTCVTWCQVGDIKIVTGGDDARHKIWRVGKEFQDYDYKKQLLGVASVVPLSEKTSSKWATLDRTPKSLKRKSTDTQSSSRKRLAKNNTSTLQIKRSIKRSLIDLMNETLSPVKELDESGEPPLKKMNLAEVDSMRVFPSTSKDNTENTANNFQRLNHCDSNKIDYYHKSPTSPSCFIKTHIFKTPTKSPRKLIFSPTSPKKFIFSPTPSSHRQCSSLLGSPTMNLPNFVLNGEAPHLRLMSPRKTSRTIDWLTQISHGKKLKTLSDSCESPSEESPPYKSIRKRRTPSSSFKKTPVQRKVYPTMLKYFPLVKDEKNES